MATKAKGASAQWQLENTTVASITNYGGATVTITNTVWSFQNVTAKRTSAKGRLRNGAGNIIGAAYAGGEKGIIARIVPSGTTLTIAKQGGKFIEEGATVVITDSDHAHINGNWICEESDIEHTNDLANPLLLVMHLFNSATSDISADASTA